MVSEAIQQCVMEDRLFRYISEFSKSKSFIGIFCSKCKMSIKDFCRSENENFMDVNSEIFKFQIQITLHSSDHSARNHLQKDIYMLNICKKRVHNLSKKSQLPCKFLIYLCKVNIFVFGFEYSLYKSNLWELRKLWEITIK